MLQEFLKERKDRAVWMPELRERFAHEEGSRPLILRLTLHDGTRKDFACALPKGETGPESDLVSAFFFAEVYNILTVCSGRELRIFCDTGDGELRALFAELDEVFQRAKKARGGFGKVLNIAERIGGGCAFALSPIEEWQALPPAEKAARQDLAELLRRQAEEADGLCLCGIDVGGSDIKLAASDRGRLVCVKEYDWNPAQSSRAEEISGPILLLTRLMRACLAAERLGADEALRETLAAALEKSAPDALIQRAVEAAESRFGTEIDLLDGIGLSFPDIVIGDRIVGGETPKTAGMRANPETDYETAFAELGRLKEPLLALCRAGGRVRLANDGNMAAYTAAVELTFSGEGEKMRRGVIAHSLGTDLGTGWLLPDGTIPPLPLELYDSILDLGSMAARSFPPGDLRSVLNENSGLAGARRYMGQAAAYRLAWELEPSLLDGFAQERDGLLCIPTEPQDLRKPCLEHLMRLAASGEPAAQEIFRRLGTHLAVVSREMQYLLSPETEERFLFGRFAKDPVCFALLKEGFDRAGTGLCLRASDEGLACSPLMRQLARRKDVTVAQFGQAVGALIFAVS